MSEYTPPTEQVREIYAEIRHEYTGFGFDTHRAEFDRWLEQVKAEAWQEGHSASESEWMHTFDGHPVPEGEMCPECSIGNPYRQETDA